MAEVMNKSGARRSELFQDIAENVASELIKSCQLPDKQAADIGNKLSDFLIQHWKGQTIYIPSDYKYKNSARDEEICARMSRGNAYELAAEYGISYVRVYQIYRRHLEEKRQQLQEARNGQAQPSKASAHPASRGLQAHNIFSGGVRHE